MKNMGDLQKMAQRMQADMAKAQAELAEATVEGSAGGGAVVVVLTGTQDIKDVRKDGHVSAVALNDTQAVEVDNKDCVRCMHCINVMPKALRPGKEKGATLLIGAKAPILQGALLSSVLIPFVPAAELHDTIKELVSRIWDFWGEYGNNRERVGELIQRMGMATFLDAIGLDPVPEMIAAPRDNPYIFFQPEGDGNAPEGAEGGETQAQATSKEVK